MAVLSDKYMLQLWRLAVLIIYCHRCAFCGMYGDDNLQVHHVVRRKHKITRYLPMNGLPLCHKCHSLAHTKMGEKKIMNILGESYEKLVDMELVSYKQYLQENKMSEKEFMIKAAEDLKAIINA